MADKFILIDGNSLANRAFYAIPMLSNAQGFITNAVYGFCNMLLRVLEEEKPQYLAVAFDLGRIVFRHREYADYKAQRKGTPDELRPQFPVLKELLGAMNIAVVELEGYEGDDLIGTLARRGEEQGLQNLIVTGDRDALQLVSPRTKVLLTKKGISELEEYDEKALLDKYGLSPRQMIDLKGLMGDASDNIPGIPGVGEKTALKLIREYGDLENALAHWQDFDGKKLGCLLRDYGEQARLSKKLAEIDRDVPVDVSITDCLLQEPDYPRLIKILQELEFKNTLQHFLERQTARCSTGAASEAVRVTGRIIREPGELAEYLNVLQGPLAVYAETHKTGAARWEIQTLGIKGKGQEAAVLDWESGDPEQYLRQLKPYLEAAETVKTVHDAKAAALALACYGIALQGVLYDTLLMTYLLDPSHPQTDLKALLKNKAGLPVLPSCREETVWLGLQTLENIVPELRSALEEQQMWGLYQDVELPLCFVLARLEQTGVLLDRKMLAEMGSELDSRIRVLMTEIYGLAGEEFNINSPKQLGAIIFDKLGLAKGKKTKTGYSTSVEVLEALAREHPIVEAILHYRQLVKLKSTYIDGLQAIADPVTGRVHTSFNQAVTSTGRLSSTEPNLQNIPIRVEEGRRIRKAFLASPGCVLLAADYSQIELRVLAHIAEDEVLREAFWRDEDIHTRTAAEVFNVPLTGVTKEMRRAAKAVNFGIIYGISDYGLSQDIGVSRAEARYYIDHYFEHYRGVKLYIDRVIAEAREKGFVTTILNRRRYLPDILSRNFNLRSFAERTAMNTPIQGSAADLIKMAMVRLQEELEKIGLPQAMLLSVHDELVLEVPPERLQEAGRLVEKVMFGVYPLAVPLKVDLETGPNWYDLKPLIPERESSIGE